MNNVKVADQKVERLRFVISKMAQHKFAPIAIDELLGYLECMERLAAVERHLYNITSNSYVKHKGQNAEVENRT